MMVDRDSELKRRQDAEQHMHQALLDSIRARLPQLEELMRALGHEYEDRLYRFYCRSNKVYYLRGTRRAPPNCSARSGVKSAEY